MLLSLKVAQIQLNNPTTMATAVPSTSSLSVIPVSHPTTSSAVEKINVACRFFPIGTCRFNEHCRYLHVDEPAAVFAVPLGNFSVIVNCAKNKTNLSSPLQILCQNHL